MKKLINGKLYNTKKLVPIASWDNGIEISDTRYSEETLCRSKTGEYIIYSKDASGLDLREITPEDAFEWLQKHSLTAKADIELIESVKKA